MTTKATTMKTETIGQGIADVLNSALMKEEPISARKAWSFGIVALVLLLCFPLIPRCEHEHGQFFVMANARLSALYGCPAWLYFGVLNAGLIALIALLSGLCAKRRYVTCNEQDGLPRVAIPLSFYFWSFVAAWCASIACCQAFHGVISLGG